MLTLLRISGILLIMGLLSASSNATIWRSLNPGLDYAIIQADKKQANHHIHVFRIDPKRYQFTIATATKNNTKITQLAAEHSALLAINGGFFTPEFTMLGLRVSQGKQLNPAHNTVWWGIFSLDKKGQARISRPDHFEKTRSIDFAIQAGPRLIINGNIPSLRPGDNQRSAIGIDKKGKVLIMITENMLLSTTDFATLIKANKQLKAHNVLNLDGGSSSQLFAHIGDFRLTVPSIRPITDAIIIKKHE